MAELLKGSFSQCNEAENVALMKIFSKNRFF